MPVPDVRAVTFVNDDLPDLYALLLIAKRECGTVATWRDKISKEERDEYWRLRNAAHVFMSRLYYACNPPPDAGEQ